MENLHNAPPHIMFSALVAIRCAMVPASWYVFCCSCVSSWRMSMLEICDDSCQFWRCLTMQESIEGQLILCQSCDSSNHRIACSNVWSTKRLVNGDAEITFFGSFSYLWTHLQLIHLIHCRSAMASVEHSCTDHVQEVFVLPVEGCQILFPVTLYACPNDVQQTFNLLGVPHKEHT